MSKKDPLNSSKKIRRKRKVLKSLFSFLIIAVLVAAVIGAANIDKLRVKEVKLESGDKTLNAQISKTVLEMISGKYLGILPKDNIFILSKKEIKEKITSKFPSIKSVLVETQMPNNLLIKFEERKQEAILCYGKNCGFLDSSGFVFEKAPYFSGDVYIKFIDEQSGGNSSLAIGKNIIEAGQFEKIMSFINIANKGKIIISKVFIKSETFFQLQTKEGWNILISDKNEPQLSFDNLALALQEKIKTDRKNLDYIDLRFGNKVYFKYKS